MIPVLFSSGSFSLTSFGLFLALAHILGLFLIWRLARAWDLDEEKILDLVILTIIGGVAGARLLFILGHFGDFGTDPLKWILFYKYAGFSFWGAILGGLVSLIFFAKRFKLDFFLCADIVVVGFLSGWALANIGCFLGGCNIGVVSDFFLSVPMTGYIGKRFPVQLLEGGLLVLLLFKVWSSALHFHKSGEIFAAALIGSGLIKLLLETFKESSAEGYFFSSTITIMGLIVFYKITGRNILKDIISSVQKFKNFFSDPAFRKNSILTFRKSWYNRKVAILWNFKSMIKILRRLNVYFSHKNSKFN